MTFSLLYKPLFKLIIQHNYFLNKGADLFVEMNDETRKKQLESYAVSSFLNVLPTAETQRSLNGHQLVLRKENSGFSIWTKVSSTNNMEPFIELNEDLSFAFLVHIKDYSFYNYTALKPENAKRLYYFSNRKPDTEPVTFPLINLVGNNININEEMILSADGEKEERALISSFNSNSLFGIIRIFIKGDDLLHNITNPDDGIIEPTPTFEMVFDNRKTTWRYFFNENQTVKNKDKVKKEDGDSQVLITKKEQPLTQTGFVSIALGDIELPNPSVQLVKPDSSTEKYYSEIYMYT